MSKAPANEKGASAGGASDGNTSQRTKTAGDKPPVRPRDLRQARMAQSFSQVVAVLMRDQNFRNMRLADLEWLVIPPVMAGQFRLAHAPPPGQPQPQGSTFTVPVAVALWARVSPQLDRSLSENLDKPVWIKPNQWASGNILWLMALAGDRRALPQFVKLLQEREFKGQEVKMRARGADGKVTVRLLNAQPAGSAG
jgi:hemolysin-activating ACP:hemolysin acyltransferase